MRNKIRSWFIRDDAATAIEFAMVGLLFLTMMLGIIEISIYFCLRRFLEGAR